MKAPAWFASLGPFGKGVAGAMIGGALFLLALQWYQDHETLRGLATFINAHAEKIVKLP